MNAPRPHEIVFTFHSTHGAMAGEQALLTGGMAVRVMALPSSLGAGCGLCLRVAHADLEASRRLLAGAGIEPEGIFAKSIDCGVPTYCAVSI
ncbi:MAG: DUF3343 domain-containing protein [Candidatus Adiutrix sp.]|jgi:hypothetical protein|nr:DUF3343 domain-containing protein [Candidatus Adiutrix sp.]